MHICHLILTHTFAGSERYAIELANQQSLTHKVSLILHTRGCETRESALLQHVSSRVKVYQVSGPKWLASQRARSLVKHLQPDVAHAHLSAACKALKRLPHTLCVASLHIHYKSTQHRHLDGLIAIAPWQLTAIPQPLLEHTRQIDNWTRAIRAGDSDRSRLREHWQVEEDHFVFGALGRVEQSKGHDNLIAAFAQLNAPMARLVIVGTGAAISSVRACVPEQIKPQVIFHGYTSEPQACLAGFDAFVSAARSEPFGLVFLEAMVAQLPIIATASQGALYLQAHFQHPPVPVDNSTALAAAMATVKSQCLQRGSAPVERVLSAYDINSRAAEITEFYKDLAVTRHINRA